MSDSVTQYTIDHLEHVKKRIEHQCTSSLAMLDPEKEAREAALVKNAFELCINEVEEVLSRLYSE